ncbi:transporter [Rufibacter psychrotolerans]|uniref:transporter n=1 Tax=Rufibacter psychrotolerans TaxID=2812556 RepID=UPI00196849F7|nr:transporter [Rufibacter sp. SYSU D00308]
MKKTCLIFLLGLFQLGAFAQEADPEFETDRPTRSEASSVVPRGYYQLETGFQYQKRKAGGLEKKQWLYPQALLRIGVLQGAELRVEGTYRREEYRRAEALQQQNKGLSTVRVGTKVRVVEARGAVPEVAVLGMLELPWAKDSFEPRHVAPAAKLLFTSKLTDKLKVQYNAGFRRQQEEGEMENQLQYAVSLNGKLTDQLTVFAEFFGDKPKGSPAENQLDAGLEWRVLPNLQLDAIVGTGVSSQAPELFVGGGVSVRLPR